MSIRMSSRWLVIKKPFSAGKSLDRSQWLIWDCDIMIMYYHRVHHLIDKLFNACHKHWLLEQKQLQPIPPLCPIVYWWITSHHTSPTPCRHCFLFFIETQPAKIDEKKTEDDFSRPYGHLAFTLLGSYSVRHLVSLPTPFSILFFFSLCFWRWARQIHYSICSMERSPFTSWLILDGSFTLSSSLTMPLM